MQQAPEYLEKLDDSQRAAVEYIDGPSLVIAGAGAGKTRVLTSKIAYLIDNGVQPWNILALTFTNKAAREMRERIALIVGEEQAKRLQMGTFHSVFSRILRTEAARIGYSPRFTIYDRSDVESLVKLIVKDMRLDEKKYKTSFVLSRISWAKNRLILADAYANNAECQKADSAAGTPAVRDVYLKYQQRLKAAEAMDFDDLLVQMFLLLNNNENVRRKYAMNFEFVLVDEYQDTNFTQAKILELLIRERQRICVVGDDAQSIYAFRGADIGNILNFTQFLPAAKLFKLERNYRSTRCIVEAANSVISYNKHRIPKHVYSLAGQGENITVKETYSDLEEADVVMRHINSLASKGELTYNDIAVLYRTNAQSRVIEESLRKNGIPYKIVGGLSFYERKEIKDVIAYFRLAVNPADEEAFRRIINYPARGIGNTTLTRITAAAVSRNISMWQAINTLSSTELGVSATAMKKLVAFVEMMSEFTQAVETTDAYTLALKVIDESGITNELNSDKTLENFNKKENIQELLTAINTFVENTLESEGSASYATVDRYLAEVALLTDADMKAEADNHVTLMTIHSAKGLEFEAVFIVGMEEEIFPGSIAAYSETQMEEERRLFYVALTRAKRYCCLTYAHSRFRYGSTTFSEPSRFISEIDEAYINKTASMKSQFMKAERTDFRSNSYDNDLDDYTSFSKRFTVSPHVSKSYTMPQERAPRGTKFSAIASTDGEAQTLQSARTQKGEVVKPGQVVEHPRFGRGVIENLTDAGDTAKAHIVFDNSGEKDLLLKFAPLKVIG